MAMVGSNSLYRGGDSYTIEIKRIENHSINKTREYSIDKPLPCSYKQREEMERDGLPRNAVACWLCFSSSFFFFYC